MKYREVVELKEMYGGHITLEQLTDILLGDRRYLCPNCKGGGQITYRYNAYPSGMPDSRWAEDWRDGCKNCDVCAGYGYTSKPMIPKMVQSGWTDKEVKHAGSREDL